MIFGESARKTLRKCQNLARSGRWQDLLESSKNPSVAKSEPRILPLRIIAANQAGRKDIVAEIARTSSTLNLDPSATIRVVRELANAGEGEAAWQVLKACPEVEGHPAFLKYIHRLGNLTDNPEIHLELKGKRRELTRDEGGIKPEPSPFRFASGEGIPATERRYSLGASSLVPPRHVERFKLEMQEFLERLERPGTPRLVEYHDVFVDRYGQIWTLDGRLISSTGHPRPEVTLDDVETLDIGFDMLGSTRGIYHWLVDRVPNLAWLKSSGETGIPILLNGEAPAFEAETLAIAGFEKGQIKPVREVIFCRRLVTAHVGFRSMVDPSPFAPILGGLAAEASRRAAAEGLDLPRHIYVSRRDAKRRSMTNEAAVEREMVRRGLVPQIFSGMPLWQQFAIVANADTVVGPHGAGLAHILLGKPGQRIFEIMPIVDGTYSLRFNYARLSLLRGLDYHAWLEEQRPTVDAWETNLAEMLPFLDASLSK